MLKIFTFIARNTVDNVTQIIRVDGDNKDNAVELAEIVAVDFYNMNEIGLTIDLFPDSHSDIIG